VGEVLPKILLGYWTAADGDGEIGVVSGHEEWKSREMIPMGMCEKEVNV
jgi:hypothetical protein